MGIQHQGVRQTLYILSPELINTELMVESYETLRRRYSNTDSGHPPLDV